MPKGLQYSDAGEYLLNGQNAIDTPEGGAWLEDQRARRDWAPAMALAMLSLGRIPGGAPPGAIGVNAGQRSQKRESPAKRDVDVLATYRDPPKSLKELQAAVATPRKGTDVHHIVEKKSAELDGLSNERINGSDNLVRIPRKKHWDINGWFQHENDAYNGMWPRNYLRGKSWDERYEVGIKALIEHGVLKP